MPRDRNCATASWAGRGSSAASDAATPAGSRERPCLERRRRAGVEGPTALIQVCHAILRRGQSLGRLVKHKSREPRFRVRDAVSVSAQADDRRSRFESWVEPGHAPAVA